MGKIPSCGRNGKNSHFRIRVLTSQLGNRKRSEARSHYPYTILA
ncbi:hypothetical protein F383_32541 [Gossypium arboreum]|uniref:Uncharacterized protein n=1 Tax=Gossypium arboreum TaxID=29729 RepID=A0A0B0PMN6_GOSAR|nr:hypothetical protein F383_32541 [Gossypium arboreum]